MRQRRGNGDAGGDDFLIRRHNVLGSAALERIHKYHDDNHHNGNQYLHGKKPTSGSSDKEKVCHTSRLFFLRRLIRTAVLHLRRIRLIWLLVLLLGIAVVVLRLLVLLLG